MKYEETMEFQIFYNIDIYWKKKILLIIEGVLLGFEELSVE